jgi:hypothetical protein
LTRHVGVEQVKGRNLDLLATDVVLIGTSHALVEDVESDFDQCRVCDPGSIVASSAFALLISDDLGNGSLVALLIV